MKVKTVKPKIPSVFKKKKKKLKSTAKSKTKNPKTKL